jgi:alkylation response protein AidB-like acyl-CoA dehydrogenase
MKNELPVIAAARALQDELLSPASMPPADDTVLAEERRAVDAFKKAALMVFGLSLQTYGPKLTDEQEVLMHTADIMMDVYSAESAVLRAIATSNAGSPRADLHVAAARVFVNDASMRIEASARQALAAMLEGDTLRTMLTALKRLFKLMPVNTAALRRQLADAAVAKGGYPL